jgi:hypothetical protein
MTGRQRAGAKFFSRRHLILIRMGLVLAIPHRRRAEALPDARIGRTILLGQPELFILRHDQAAWLPTASLSSRLPASEQVVQAFVGRLIRR